jgi:hypothetical protein
MITTVEDAMDMAMVSAMAMEDVDFVVHMVATDVAHVVVTDMVIHTDTDGGK